MSHRFRALEELEAELVRVTAHQQAGEGRARLARRFAGAGHAGRIAAALCGVALLIVTSTIALAATGVILTGSSVRPATVLNPYVGAGLPLPGQSKLLPLQVPDPYGGLPWGMRVVHTTRGLVCVQIGRVQNGTLGELGIDGAYHDDGRFHPVGPGVLPAYAGGATEGGVTSERGSCVLADGDVTGNGEAWGSAVAAEFTGVSENAAFALNRRPGSARPPHSLRDIAYGILGPHAVSVSYREGNTIRTERVAPGVGAYLIVQRVAAGSREQGQGAAPGTDTPGEGPGTSGVLTIISYERDGKICENGYNAATGQKVKIQHPCPPPNPYPQSLRVTPPGSFVRHPTVALEVHHGAVTAAEVSFSAPFPVTSAAEGYSLEGRSCVTGRGGFAGAGFVGAVLDHNVARGAIVHMVVAYPFAARCARHSVSVEVIYDSSGPEAKRSYGRTPGELLIGTTTIRLPRGDRAAAPPYHRPP
ncbi:MAG: hypothetical protein ABSG93_06810 [Solirubrobacteraceae bacterium]